MRGEAAAANGWRASRLAGWLAPYRISRFLPGKRMGWIGTGLTMFWILTALFAPILAPFDPDVSYAPLLRPFSHIAGVGGFWFGTDQLGRDILSRILWGGRRVLIYGPTAVAISYALGIMAGSLAGYLGGWIDEILSRLADAILSLPAMPLFVVIVSDFGPSAITLLACITIVNTPRVMRMVRGLVIEARQAGYVQAAQMRGEGSFHIMIAEILPNISGPLIVDACVRLGYVIIAIGALGFLGLGLPPPTAEWGTMIAEGREVLLASPHVVLAPCAALSSFIVGVTLLADGLKQWEVAS